MTADHGHSGDRLGVLRRAPDGTYTIHFERALAHPPGRVWTALTDPAEARHWFTEMTMDPRVGGQLHFDFGQQGEAHGEVLVWEPPRLLEHSWTESGVTSHVRWELLPEADGTRVVLTHTRLATDAPQEYGAGWHEFLVRLPAYLAGQILPEEGRFEALVDRYAQAASTIATRQ